MSRRTDLLEFAVLGLLHETPMHGYELRKRLNAALGAFRALSYGTLYPCLKSLTQQRLIATSSPSGAPAAASGRARIVYELTADGKEQFQTLLRRTDASAYDDDTFDVRLAFFTRTEAQVRLRILEGRRSTLEDRLANVRTASAKNRERFDAWTTALQRHGEEQTEREVRWLTELIDAERQLRPGTAAHRGPLTDPSHPAYAPRTSTPSPT
ncbi:MAG: PadR family transcriptional regulator [Nostocoides sp.]